MSDWICDSLEGAYVHKMRCHTIERYSYGIPPKGLVSVVVKP